MTSFLIKLEKGIAICVPFMMNAILEGLMEKVHIGIVGN
nr:MAG TPA: hypothetical protein [Caudoviricetes sp.]